MEGWMTKAFHPERENISSEKATELYYYSRMVLGVLTPLAYYIVQGIT